MLTLCLIVVSDVEKASMQHYKVYQSSFSSVFHTLTGQFGNCLVLCVTVTTFSEKSSGTYSNITSG